MKTATHSIVRVNDILYILIKSCRYSLKSGSWDNNWIIRRFCWFDEMFGEIIWWLLVDNEILVIVFEGSSGNVVSTVCAFIVDILRSLSDLIWQFNEEYTYFEPE